MEFQYRDLEDLRGKLTREQKDILGRIWEYYRERSENIPTKVLHHSLGKPTVLAAGQALGGNIFHEVHENGQYRYKATLLGVLVGEKGVEAESLLVRFFKYLQDRYDADPEVELLTKQEVVQALSLSPNSANELGRLLNQIWLLRTYSPNFVDWTATVPRDVDDFPGIKDFREYVCARLVQQYDPEAPFSDQERLQDRAKKQSEIQWLGVVRDDAFQGPATDSGEPDDQALDFAFVSDERLRRQLESDWNEANEVFGVSAWKSCVILCGGIIEGALLDTLKGNQDKAEAAYAEWKRRKAPPLEEWDLVDLVEISKKLEILRAGLGHLGHAIREFRNLIHPGKQLRERITVTKEEATIALSAVKICIRNLSSLI